jgi:hypothetical protein
MNPEAAAWLESLTEEQHLDLFKPAVGAIGLIASLKLSHESSQLCLSAGCYRPGALVTFQ